jgi:hypothetical protein
LFDRVANLQHGNLIMEKVSTNHRLGIFVERAIAVHFRDGNRRDRNEIYRSFRPVW